jgi:putative ABC transport system permease protein
LYRRYAADPFGRSPVSTFGQDLRFSFRALRQRPAVTVVAIVALGLAIGSTTAMFSVINAVLLKPLNFDDPERVVIVWESNPKAGLDIFSASAANFLDWQSQNTVFSHISAFNGGDVTLTGVDDNAERVGRVNATGEFFQVLRTSAVIGRALTVADEDPANDQVAVISHGFWMNRFGGNPSVLGRDIFLDGRRVSVVGVMPQGFAYPPETDVWVPMRLAGSTVRGAHFYLTVARLKDGVTLEAADAEMKTIAARLSAQYPQSNENWTILVFDLHEFVVRDLRSTVLVLFGAVGFVLLIACANVANLLLARGADRMKEIAVRSALGAGRLRVLRQLLTENIVLALAGGVLGIALAWAGLRVLLSIAPANLPRLNETELSAPVLLFSIALSILTGIVFGIVPALHLSRSNLGDTLKDASRGSSGGRERHVLRSMLVVAEIALTIVVTAGAGLMIQSLDRLHAVDPGFNPDNVLTLQFSLPGRRDVGNETVVRFNTPESRNEFVDRLLERVHALPGVTHAGTTSHLPLTEGESTLIYAVDGRVPQTIQNWPNAQIRWVTPELFDALQIPFALGRKFTSQDRTPAPPVVIINEALAQRTFPGEEAIGKRLFVGGPNNKPSEIVGIVRNTQEADLRETRRALIYIPYFQSPAANIRLAVRTRGDPAALANPLRQQIAAMDKDIAIYSVQTMEEIANLSLAQTRFATTLLGTFAMVALLIASVGVYGVIAYSVDQRTHEFGIRMALGAERRDVLKMVLRQALLLSAVGAVLGTVFAFAMTRWLGEMLFQVNPTDPVTLAAVALFLVIVAVAASLVPARRATLIDPMIALRYE